MRHGRVLQCLLPLALLFWAGAPALPAADWPQLQADAARTGRSADEVAPPYRARWLWFGPAGTLRNRLSRPGAPGWTNDLTSGPGKSYPLPAQVPFTLAGTMQPIVHRGRVLVASLEGKVFAIQEEDGATAWEADLPGGSLATGAAAGEVVVFASLRGSVHAYHLNNGRPLWTVSTGRAITGAPCLAGDRLYVANHAGLVCAMHLESGRVLWQSARLGAAVQGSLAATSNAVYAVAENLKVYRLDARDGTITATRQIYGQSFRLQWPVIHAGRLWVRTAPAWCVGSEYVNDPLLATATSLADEEEKFLLWLEGRAAFGPLSAPHDWKSFFALNLEDLTEPYVIPCGPSEGCGQPPNPPAVTSRGELVAWWPTRHPALVGRGGAFGTRYFLDLAAVDIATGRRKPLDAGPPAHVWPMETDNLYALTTGGRFCYWRQRFRGTYAMDLEARRHYQVQVEVRDRDGGVWSAPVMYVDRRQDGLPRTPSPATAGRVGAAVANGRLYLCESYGITAVETAAGSPP
ncbi:MAG: PQQ-binding-like beta-propeller repeat protein [Verrucomicrobiae bacterium]|nr:PQQ-binding-like beta-propeller repeat protein [Verrucomicrobiae bacterium]